MTSLRRGWFVHKSSCHPVQLLSVSTPCVEQTVSKTPPPTCAPASSIVKVRFLACIEPNVAIKIGQLPHLVTLECDWGVQVSVQYR